MNKTIFTRSDEADKYLVYAKLDNAKVLHQLVKAVSFKEVISNRFLAFTNLILLFYEACRVLCD